jgi:hypothetical protein
MTRVVDLAKVVRSKNAGALLVTLDLMFPDEASYRRVLRSQAITAQRVAALYGVSENAVQIIPYDVAWAIKITLPRRVASGDPADSDVYGAQQHAPLFAIEIGDETPPEG